MKRIVILIAFVLLFPNISNGWEGVDLDTGNDVEIERGNLVRRGNDIEIYDYGDNSYKDVEVTGIYRDNDSVIIDIYDYENGE